MRAIALMSWWQFRNAIRTTLTEPRKLIPALVFLGLMGLQALNFVFIGSQSHQTPIPLVSEFIRLHASAARSMVFLFLAVLSVGQLESGLTGGALTFSLSDVDYLFPAPISRRIVLLYRIPAIVFRNLLYIAFFLFIGYLTFWRMTDAGQANLSGLPLYVAVSCWLCGYTCIAITLEIVFGLGKARLAHKFAWAFLAALVGAIAMTIWRGGIDGIGALERSWVLGIPFYPCRLLADAFVSPLTGKPAGGSIWQLAVFFAATLLLLLTRTENYYEVTLTGSERIARLREAARSGSFSAIFAARFRNREAGRKGRATPYALPLFGRGAGAVFWAHLSSAAKRPFVNFVLPFSAGLVSAVVALMWLPGSAVEIVAGIDAYVTWSFLLIATRSSFRQCVQLRSLVRPFPIRPWKVVVADVTPTVLTGSLFGWGAGLALLGYGGKERVIVAAALLFAAPALVCALALIQYVIALWYPSAQDKMQQLLSGFVSMALFGATAIVLTPFIAVPLILRASLPVVVASGFIGSIASVCGLLALASSVFRRAEIA
ncbi:MAG TPA: putative ABC exporter domain-containing protein [Armatimonadota bacterium]|jgi:hypothetical protein